MNGPESDSARLGKYRRIRGLSLSQSNIAIQYYERDSEWG